ncbi:MAG: MmgE/PrpD family protein [Candidatus Korobacteraceae bacterium]|jgi:2-methylcitrate dehydratase PrpD
MLIDVYAEYARHDAGRELPPEVIHYAKRALLDWFSALIPGTRVSPAVNLVQAYAAELGHGKSSLPGLGTVAFPGTAAWINGSASHSVEFDDIFRDAIYHPGCPTIAAALATAEDRGRSGLELLKAITIGYEISTRIGAAIQPSHYKFFHTTGTVGCFGAAAAAVTLIAPKDANAARHALATAASLAAGLQQAFRSDAMTKPLHAGHAAWVGVAAATGAAHGVTGALDILEGQAGFIAALSQVAPSPQFTEGLGERYNVMQVTQKNHGCCGHTFSSIDSALLLRARNNLDPAQVKSIAIDTAQIPINVTGNFAPRTEYEAKFSLPYVVAHALLYGSVRLNAFIPERIADPAIRNLMSKVTLQADAEMTAKFPNMRSARVAITMQDGSRFEHFQPHRKGDPEAPLSDAELNDKFYELTSPVIGRQAAAQLLDQLWNMEKLQVADLRLAALKSLESLRLQQTAG